MYVQFELPRILESWHAQRRKCDTELQRCLDQHEIIRPTLLACVSLRALKETSCHCGMPQPCCGTVMQQAIVKGDAPTIREAIMQALRIGQKEGTGHIFAKQLLQDGNYREDPIVKSVIQKSLSRKEKYAGAIVELQEALGITPIAITEKEESIPKKKEAETTLTEATKKCRKEYYKHAQKCDELFSAHPEDISTIIDFVSARGLLSSCSKEKGDECSTVLHYYVREKNEHAIQAIINRAKQLDYIYDDDYVTMNLLAALGDQTPMPAISFDHQPLPTVDSKTIEVLSRFCTTLAPDPNTQQNTPLIVAAGNNLLGITQCLYYAYGIEYLKANPDATSKEIAHGCPTNTDGMTALMCAANYGHLSIVQFLLGQGFDPNRENNFGVTALLCAAREGHFKSVQYLLMNGANVNHANNDGRTAIHWAARKGHANIVELLIEAQADALRTDNTGVTALLCAAQEGHLNIVQYLLRKGAHIGHADNKGNTAIHLAAFKGHADTVEYLIKCGADVNSKGEHGNTPLILAVREDRESVIKVLCQAEDININFSDNGFTALLQAVINGHLESLILLLSYGAKADSVNASGTPLIASAAHRGHTHVIKCLAEAAPMKILEPNSEGRTSLHMAAKQSHSKILQELLIHAQRKTPKDIVRSVNTPDSKGLTPLHLAIQAPKEEDLFIDNQQLRPSYPKEKLSMVTTLLKYGAEIRADDKKLWDSIFGLEPDLQSKIITYILKYPLPLKAVIEYRNMTPERRGALDPLIERHFTSVSLLNILTPGVVHGASQLNNTIDTCDVDVLTFLPEITLDDSQPDDWKVIYRPQPI